MAFDHSSLRGLRSAPDCRSRRALLHLSYSYASPCGPALLVTQDPKAPLTGCRSRPLSFVLNWHRFRRAAATLWSSRDPANVRGAKDLLGHASFGTTEKYYIMAQSRLAGRALARTVRMWGQDQGLPREIRRVLSDLVKDELDAMREDCPVSRERAVRFVVGTFLTVLTWLLERKPKVSTAEVDEMFRRHEKIVGLRPQISPGLDVNAIRGCLQVTATVGGVRSLAKHLSQYRPVSL